MSAIKKWSIDKVRRATEEKGPRSLKSHNSAEVNVISLSVVTVKMRRKIFLTMGR